MNVRRKAFEVSKRTKMESDVVSERCHQVLLSTRQIVKVRDEQKDMTMDTVIKLRLLYEEGSKLATLALVADVVNLKKGETKLEGKLEEKGLQ